MAKQTHWFGKIIIELKEAGFEFVRNNSSHHIYRNSEGKNVVVPIKIDDRNIVQRIRRKTRLTNG
jgi:predicted RNA binding protein YcfA (HicA-like mRNA interferase family)